MCWRYWGRQRIIFYSLMDLGGIPIEVELPLDFVLKYDVLWSTQGCGDHENAKRPGDRVGHQDVIASF